MTTNLAWYTARAAGLVSWFLLAASISWGVLLSTKVMGRKPGPKWLLDLHRFLGGLSVVFVGIHVVALMLDTYVHFGLVQVLVPFTSSYRPSAVAWGIAGFYLLLAIEVTSLLMKRLSRKVWHAIHLGSFGLFVVATVHLLTAGTDASNPILRFVAGSVTTLVVGFTILKVASRKPVGRAPSRSGSVVRGQREALVAPAFDAADHLLDRSPEVRQADRGLVGTVAVWPGAVHDEERLGWVGSQVALDDATVRQAHGTGDVSRGEQLGAAHVEQHEPRLDLREGFVHVPAVGLEREQRLEVGQRIG